MEENRLELSRLGHTWILDLDGTLVKHNGYKIDGKDTLLPGAKMFAEGIPKEDMVILVTSRESVFREQTELFLRENGIRFDYIIYGAPYGERILVNDDKESGLCMAYALRRKRDSGIDYEITLRDDL